MKSNQEMGFRKQGQESVHFMRTWWSLPGLEVKPGKKEIRRECEWEKDTVWSQGLVPLPPLALSPKWEGKKIVLPMGSGGLKIRGCIASLKLYEETVPCDSPTPT